MIAKVTRLIAPLAFLALAVAGPAFADDDATVFIQSVYQTGWDKIASDDTIRENTLAPGFAKTVASHQALPEEDRVAYDPLAGDKEAGITDVSVELLKETKTLAKVHVTFKNGGTDSSVDMLLNKTKNGLRINEIVLTDGTKVRQDMAKAVKQANKADGKSKKPGKKGKRKNKKS